MWLERVGQASCLGARLDHLVLRLAIHLGNTPYSADKLRTRCVSLGRLDVVHRVFLLFEGKSGVTRDSNLVDSASSIRLSQRLSHACLSTDYITVKLRMAH